MTAVTARRASSGRDERVEGPAEVNLDGTAATTSPPASPFMTIPLRSRGTRWSTSPCVTEGDRAMIDAHRHHRADAAIALARRCGGAWGQVVRRFGDATMSRSTRRSCTPPPTSPAASCTASTPVSPEGQRYGPARRLRGRHPSPRPSTVFESIVLHGRLRKHAVPRVMSRTTSWRPSSRPRPSLPRDAAAPDLRASPASRRRSGAL